MYPLLRMLSLSVLYLDAELSPSNFKYDRLIFDGDGPCLEKRSHIAPIAIAATYMAIDIPA